MSYNATTMITDAQLLQALERVNDVGVPLTPADFPKPPPDEPNIYEILRPLLDERALPRLRNAVDSISAHIKDSQTESIYQEVMRAMRNCEGVTNYYREVDLRYGFPDRDDLPSLKAIIRIALQGSRLFEPHSHQTFAEAVELTIGIAEALAFQSSLIVELVRYSLLVHAYRASSDAIWQNPGSGLASRLEATLSRPPLFGTARQILAQEAYAQLGIVRGVDRYGGMKQMIRLVESDLLKEQEPLQLDALPAMPSDRELLLALCEIFTQILSTWGDTPPGSEPFQTALNQILKANSNRANQKVLANCFDSVFHAPDGSKRLLNRWNCVQALVLVGKFYELHGRWPSNLDEAKSLSSLIELAEGINYHLLPQGPSISLPNDPQIHSKEYWISMHWKIKVKQKLYKLASPIWLRK